MINHQPVGEKPLEVPRNSRVESGHLSAFSLRVTFLPTDGPDIMRWSFRGLVLVVGMASVVWSAPPQVPKKAASGLPAVDVVTLKSGRTLRGAVLQRGADRSVTMAVSRAWLKTANPELFSQYDAANTETQRDAWQAARDRLKSRLEEVMDTPRLTFFLQTELEQIEQHLAAEEPKQADFLWVELPSTQVAKLTSATPEHQKLAVIAWNEGFVDVETQDATSLQRELLKRKIPVDGPAPDLSSRLPPRPQDDVEWSARLAVMDYVYRQPLDFQGLGDTLVRTGEGQKPDLTAVFQKVMQQQVDSLLKDLLNEGPPRPEPFKPERELFAPAITTAESMGTRGFRVTRLQMEPERNRVRVETRFVAQVEKDRWQTLFVAVESADSSQARPEMEAKITQDPQVKSVLESLRTVGVFDESPLQTAVRTGAATMAAMQSADQAFFAFTNRYSQHVDRPKLFLPKP